MPCPPHHVEGKHLGDHVRPGEDVNLFIIHIAQKCLPRGGRADEAGMRCITQLLGASISASIGYQEASVLPARGTRIIEHLDTTQYYTIAKSERRKTKNNDESPHRVFTHRKNYNQKTKQFQEKCRESKATEVRYFCACDAKKTRSKLLKKRQTNMTFQKKEKEGIYEEEKENPDQKEIIPKPSRSHLCLAHQLTTHTSGAIYRIVPVRLVIK